MKATTICANKRAFGGTKIYVGFGIGKA